jgi:hypothetical protein
MLKRDPVSRPRGVCHKARVNTHTYGPSSARESRKFDIADACVRTLRRDGRRSFRQQNYLFVIKTTKFVTFLNCYTSYIRANTWHCPRPMSVWAKISFLLISLTDVRCNSITETKTALLFLLAISRRNRVHSNMLKTCNETNILACLASLHRPWICDVAKYTDSVQCEGPIDSLNLQRIQTTYFVQRL